MRANAAALEVDDFDLNNIGVKWVVTDVYGLLLEASREAADMLNLSVAGLRSRQLLVFFDGEREHWRQALRAAAAGMMVDREGAVRPRDRRPLFIRAEITKTRDCRHGDTCCGRSPNRTRAKQPHPDPHKDPMSRQTGVLPCSKPERAFEHGAQAR